MVEQLKAGLGVLGQLEDEPFQKLLDTLVKRYICKTENIYTSDNEDGLDSKDRYILENTLIYLIEQILGTLDTKTTVSTLIEKLKGIQPEKKAIMTKCIDGNLNGLKKVYLESVIAGSNYYLEDFNWNIDVCLNSSELTKLKQGILQLELILRKFNTREEKRVIIELNNEELEGFIQNLYALQTKLEQ